MPAESTCHHCDKTLPAAQVVRLVALLEVTCCDECADELLAGGEVSVCHACLALADADMRMILPATAGPTTRALADRLERAADTLEVALASLRDVEDREALLQCLSGGAGREAEVAYLRLLEKGPLIVGELRTGARLYARLAELRRA